MTELAVEQPNGDTLLIWSMKDYIGDVEALVLMYMKAHYPQEFKLPQGSLPEHVVEMLKDPEVLESVLKYMLRVMWMGQTLKHQGLTMLQQLGGMVELCMHKTGDTEQAHSFAVFTAEVCEKMLNIVPSNVACVQYLALRDGLLYAIGKYHES